MAHGTWHCRTFCDIIASDSLGSQVPVQPVIKFAREIEASTDKDVRS